MEFTLDLASSPFDLKTTLESGQVFRWEGGDGGWWHGVLEGGVVRLRQDGLSLHCESSAGAVGPEFVRGYFRLDEDVGEVLSTVMKDPVIIDAARRFYGLRLIRQPVWECLISFVVATNSNIPNIKRMLSNLCRRFGEPMSFEGAEYNLFPSPEALASATMADLRGCGLGYRAQFVKGVSDVVYRGEVDLSELLILDYADAREFLTRRLLGRKVFLGIGPKVADCVLLFSCEKSDAFPTDVWIARALSAYYPQLLDERLRKRLRSRVEGKGGLTPRDYSSVTEAMRLYFGRHAGYAQQLLFLLARSSLSP